MTTLRMTADLIQGLIAGSDQDLLLLFARASAVMGGGWVTVWTLRRSSAATRHMVWALTFTAVLLLPVATRLTPTWSVLPTPSWDGVPLGPGPSSNLPTARQAGRPSVVAGTAEGRQEQDHAPYVAKPGLASDGSSRPGTAGSGTSVVTARPPAAGGKSVVTTRLPAAPIVSASGTGAGDSRGPTFARLLMLVWLSGVAVQLMVVGVGMVRIRWLVRRAMPNTDPTVRRLAAVAADNLGLRRVPVILGSAQAPVPMTWGIANPRILLPKQASSWERARLHRVLLHEMAHIKRGDLVAQMVSELVCALHWFNPLVWAGAARMRMEREHASDDLVLRGGFRASDYAQDLLDVVRGLSVPAFTSGAIWMARPSQLGDRMKAVLDPSRSRAAVGGARRGIATGIGAILLWAAAAATPAYTEVVGVAEQSASGTLEAPPQTEEPRALVVEPRYGTPLEARTSAGAQYRAPVEPAPATPIEPGPAVPSEPSPAVPSVTFAELCSRPRKSEDRDNWATIITEDGSRIRGTMISSGDGETEAAWTGRDCWVKVTTTDGVRFNGAETEVVYVPRGGVFEVEHMAPDVTRKLTVRSSRSGGLDFQFQVDGREATFDASARAWLAEIIPSLLRNTGLQAQERATRILRDEGMDGLIAEIRMLPSDHVASRYLAIGFAEVETDGDRRRLLRLAGEELEGDYELAKVLVAAAESVVMSDGMRRVVIEAAASLEGDYELANVFEALIEHQELNRDDLLGVLDLARRELKGDYEMAGLYISLMDESAMDGALMSDLLWSAGQNIDGDYELGPVNTIGVLRR